MRSLRMWRIRLHTFTSQSSSNLLPPATKDIYLKAKQLPSGSQYQELRDDVGKLLCHFLYLITDKFELSCAALHGIDPAIVSRANEIASLAARGENLIAACATLSAEETQLLENAVRTPWTLQEFPSMCIFFLTRYLPGLAGSILSRIRFYG